MINPERFETDLPPDLAQFVHSRVGDDALATNGDVLREVVRQAAQLQAFQEATSAKIAAGVASLRAGLGVDGEAFMATLDAELAEHEQHGK